jgi:hypothetical protein
VCPNNNQTIFTVDEIYGVNVYSLTSESNYKLIQNFKWYFGDNLVSSADCKTITGGTDVY